MIELTERQRQMMTFIRMRIDQGSQPTIREIAEFMEIRSPNGITRHLELLAKKGKVWRDEEGKLVVS